MTISDLAKRATQTLIANSPAILTGLGAAGLVGTAYLAGKAGFHAAARMEQYQTQLDEFDQEVFVEATAKEFVKETWQLFIPAATVGAVSIVCIIGSAKISSRRNAALIGLYSVTEQAFQQYKDKIVEQIGVKEEQKARDSIAQDRVAATPVSSAEVIITGNGDVLCMDAHTSRYFQSQMESLRKVENDLNYDLINGDGYFSLNDYYHKVGLRSVEGGDDAGWNSDTKFELEYSTTMSDDGRPCILITFKKGPIPNFYKLW